MNLELKRREAQLRRRTDKIGCRIEKSRTKNMHSNDRGGYQLIDRSNTVIDGVDFDLNIETLERCVARLEVAR